MTAHAAQLTAPATRRALLVAAIGYSLLWIVGLMVPVSAVDFDATARAALAWVVGHEGAIALQSVLVHGLAAIALATVAIALSRSVARAGQAAIANVVRGAGLIAAALSLLQCALELVLAGPVASERDAGAAGAIVEVVNRVDGLKMFVLAVFALAGAAAVRRAAVLPRWLGVVGAALAVAIVVSGLGYCLLVPTLALAAAVSLPLLLVFVTGAGVVLARETR